MNDVQNEIDIASLKAALESNQPDGILHALDEVRVKEIYKNWSDFSENEKITILEALSPEDAADVFSHLDAYDHGDLLESLSVDSRKQILDELSLDDLTDTINAVGEESPAQAEALLRELDPETRAEVEGLAEYDDDEAGGIMTSEYIAVRDQMRVDDVFRFLRREASDAEQISVLYVVDGEEHLTGVLTIKDLILADPKTKVAEIMESDVIFARDEMDQEHVAKLMADYNFNVLPVVDDKNTLLGIITIDDVIDVIQEEATEDIHRMGGVEGVDLVYSQSSIFELWSARVRWLAILIIGAMFSSSILEGFQDTLKAILPLTFYVTILLGAGGNTGNQSSTLIVRALATGDVRGRDTLKILGKELMVGLLLGLTLAAMLSLKIVFDGNSEIVWVVAVSLGILMTLTNMIGAILPIGIKKIGLDPALISSPLIATLSDLTGLLVYLSLARYLLNL